MTGNAQPRDVVLQAMRFEQTETCPYYIWADPEMVGPLSEAYGRRCFVQVDGSPPTFDGSFTAMTEIRARPVWEDGECFEDEYGARIRRGSILHVESPALSGPTASFTPSKRQTEPPPAATVSMAIIGATTRTPAFSVSYSNS